MATKECLLVGGAFDGKRQVVFLPPYEKIEMIVPVEKLFEKGKSVVVGALKKEAYTLSIFRTKEKDFFVYKYKELTDADVMERLIKNYKKKGRNMNKYELMGKYVCVKAYQQPAKRLSARSHETIILKEPRVGMVVGYRTVYDGEIHSGSQQSSYFNDLDYDPPYFIPTESIKVLLVCFWPTHKPVLVKPEDVMIPMAVLKKVTDNLHPTIYPWHENQKSELRKIMSTVPRDKKGRWIKARL